MEIKWIHSLSELRLHAPRNSPAQSGSVASLAWKRLWDRLCRPRNSQMAGRGSGALLWSCSCGPVRTGRTLCQAEVRCSACTDESMKMWHCSVPIELCNVGGCIPLEGADSVQSELPWWGRPGVQQGHGMQHVISSRSFPRICARCSNRARWWQSAQDSLQCSLHHLQSRFQCYSKSATNISTILLLACSRPASCWPR